MTLLKKHKSIPDTTETVVTIAPSISIQAELRKVLNIHPLPLLKYKFLEIFDTNFEWAYFHTYH